MSKIFIIIAIIILAAGAVYLWQKDAIIEFVFKDALKFPDPYYNGLYKNCADSCCEESVERMAAGNYKLLESYKVSNPENNCPAGSRPNMLKCVTSYRWCEPEDEIANWKTYRNEEYGFEMKYPPSFSLSAVPNQLFFVEEGAPVVDAKLEITIDKVMNRFNLYFNAPIDTNVQNYSDIKLRNFLIEDYNAVEYGYNDAAKKKEIEENKSAIKRGASVGMIYFPRGIMINKDGTIINVFTNSYNGDFKKIFNQILATFKFIK